MQSFLVSAVIGGGHSAINAILEFMDLHEADAATQITWVLRKAAVEATYGGLENDELPGALVLGMVDQEIAKIPAGDTLYNLLPPQ